MVDKWSHADQALLEEAIFLYSAESCPDVKNRWLAISKHVGKPVKDCVARVISRAKECGAEAGKSAQGEKEAAEKEKQRKAQEAREKERKDDDTIEEELRRKREQAEKDRVETLRKLKESEERERQEQERKEKERKDLADQQERDRLKRSEEADKRIALAQKQQKEAEQRRQQEMMGKAHYAKAAKRNEIERKKKEKEDRLAQAAREAMGAISQAEHKVVDADELRKNEKCAIQHTACAPASSSTRKSKTSSGSSENECTLCAEKKDLWIVGQCGHRSMCANCGLRMRLLLDNKRCMECQVEIEDFVCTSDRECPFSDFGIYDRIATGRPHVYFIESIEGFVDGEENAENMRYLQSYRKCPLKCGYWGPDNIKALEKHVWDAHYMEFCRLCLEFKKDFIQNQVAYSKNDLTAHIRVGDDVSAKGHPQCQFCKKRFYSDTEYGKHLRDSHFWCHICEKSGRRDVFFGSHPALYKHFESHHYVCYQPECKAESWVVFATQADLDAHHVDKHDPKQVGALLNFSFQTPNRGGRSGPSREAPQQTQGVPMHPTPMAPILSRDEEFPSLAGGPSAPSSAGPTPNARPPMAKATAPKSKAPSGPGRGKAPAVMREEDFPTLGGKASFSPPTRQQNNNMSSASSSAAGPSSSTGMFAKIAAGANRNEQIAAAAKAKTKMAAQAPAKSTFNPAVDDFPSLPKPSRKVGHKPKTWATTPGPAPVSSSSAAPKTGIEAIPKTKMSQKAKKKLELRSLAFNK